MAKVKEYELSRFDAMAVRVVYMGQTILAHFKGGSGLRSRARLVTRDPFIQAALEHDSRYGKLFTLVKTYDDTPVAVSKVAAEKAAPKRVSKVKTVNDALLYFTQLGANVTGDSDLSDLMEKYNVEFPNLRKSS